MPKFLFIFFFPREDVFSFKQLIYPESHDKPGQHALRRYIQMKSSKIYSLHGLMQTCMSHHPANLSHIKPLYSFTAGFSRQMEKQKSPGKIKTHLNLKRNWELAEAGIIYSSVTVYSLISFKASSLFASYSRSLLLSECKGLEPCGKFMRGWVNCFGCAEILVNININLWF